MLLLDRRTRVGIFLSITAIVSAFVVCMRREREKKKLINASLLTYDYEKNIFVQSLRTKID
jgi:hypothetical protein